MFNSALVVTAFRRLDTLERVLSKLSDFQFPKIYLIVDGPRDSNIEEQQLCEAVCEFIKSYSFSSPTETIIRSSNWGIKRNLLDAFGYIFSKEEYIYFIEDDHVPTKSFFDFVDFCWNNYSVDSIYHINGTNLDNRQSGFAYLSKLSSFWGCSISRHAWINFDYDLVKKLSEEEVYNTITRVFSSSSHQNYFMNLYRYHRIGEAEEVFDQRWLFYLWYKDVYCLTPRHNLIENIGINHSLAYSKVKSKKMQRLKKRTAVVQGIDSQLFQRSFCLKYDSDTDARIMNDIFCFRDGFVVRMGKKIFRKILNLR